MFEWRIHASFSGFGCSFFHHFFYFQLHYLVSCFQSLRVQRVGRFFVTTFYFAFFLYLFLLFSFIELFFCWKFINRPVCITRSIIPLKKTKQRIQIITDQGDVQWPTMRQTFKSSHSSNVLQFGLFAAVALLSMTAVVFIALHMQYSGSYPRYSKKLWIRWTFKP